MKLHNFNKKELVAVYKKMVMSRFLDNKQLIMLKQGKSFFHIEKTIFGILTLLLDFPQKYFGKYIYIKS